MKHTKKIALALAVITLLPALFYTALEVSSLSRTEEFITDLYGRQLDAILFSVNQYTLDAVSSWSGTIANDRDGSGTKRLLRSAPSILSIIESDSALTWWHESPNANGPYREIIRSRRETVDRLLQYQSLSYRKLEPVALGDSAILILFAMPDPVRIGGIVVHNDRFIGDVIGKKLSELAQNDLVLTVQRISDGRTIYTTERERAGTDLQQRPLWIFPDHRITIRLRGTTIAESAQERYGRNLLLIGIVDVLILGGALFAYRLVKKEMDLAALKTDFVSNVSHELRTPLSLIRMFAETLEMKRVPTEEQKQEYYGIILRETERLTRLINNILNFSRMESASRTYTFAPADLHRVVTDTLAVHSFPLEQKGFTLRTSLAPDLPPVLLDAEAIAEALHNLIDNAVKYSAEVRELSVTTERRGDSVVLSVADKGIGIAPEHQRKVFEKFYRVSQGLVHTAKGSGLGLAIVRHIVDAHHGDITLSSTPGSGTTVRITLPLSPSGH